MQPRRSILVILALSTLSSLAPPGALACPACFFETSTLSVEDRNGPPLERGDLLDWTLQIKNTGCITSDVIVTMELAPGEVLDPASKGPAYDLNLHTLRWDSSTTPALGRVAGHGGPAVELRVGTQVFDPGAEGRVCHQAFITILTPCQDHPRRPVPTNDPATALVAADSTCIPRTTPVEVHRVQPCRGSLAEGMPVRIHGSGFAEGVRVTVGSWRVAEVLKVEPDTIEAILPADWGTNRDLEVRDEHSYQVLYGGIIRTFASPGTVRALKDPAGVRLQWSLVATHVIERSTSRDFDCPLTETFNIHASEAVDATPTDATLHFYRVN